MEESCRGWRILSEQGWQEQRNCAPALSITISNEEKLLREVALRVSLHLTTRRST